MVAFAASRNGHWCLLAFALFAALAQISNAKLTEKPLDVKSGKGPCNGDAECLNNGKCEPQKSSDAGECYCAIPYMGEFCEEKATTSLTDVKKSKKSAIGQKRMLWDFKGSIGKDVSVLSVHPDALADAQDFGLICDKKQDVCIYASNTKGDEVEVKASKKDAKEKFLFKVQHVDNDPNSQEKYFIYNPDVERYLYVSAQMVNGFRLVVAKSSPKKPDPSLPDFENYLFTFDRGSDNGFQIYNNDLQFFISDPSKARLNKRMVKVANKDSSKLVVRETSFKFFLPKAPKSIEAVEISGSSGKEIVDTKASLLEHGQCKMVCNDKGQGKMSYETKHKVDQTEQYTFTLANAFNLNGNIKVGSASFALQAGISVTQTKTESESQTTMVSNEETGKFDIDKNKCACVFVKYDSKMETKPFQVKVTTASNKVLIADASIARATKSNYQLTYTQIKVGEKCPFA